MAPFAVATLKSPSTSRSALWSSSLAGSLSAPIAPVNPAQDSSPLAGGEDVSVGVAEVVSVGVVGVVSAGVSEVASVGVSGVESVGDVVVVAATGAVVLPVV